MEYHFKAERKVFVMIIDEKMSKVNDTMISAQQTGLAL